MVRGLNRVRKSVHQGISAELSGRRSPCTLPYSPSGDRAQTHSERVQNDYGRPDKARAPRPFTGCGGPWAASDSSLTGRGLLPHSIWSVPRASPFPALDTSLTSQRLETNRVLIRNFDEHAKVRHLVARLPLSKHARKYSYITGRAQPVNQSIIHLPQTRLS